ncbi:unnamed protein product [Ectocarpus sp. 4 AP-2014]
MNGHTFVNIVLFEGKAQVLTSDSLLVAASDESKEMLLDLFGWGPAAQPTLRRQ